MSGSLQGKVAVVTGASKGIGASIAKAFAAQGASVVVNYASSRAGAETVVAEIGRAGGRAIAVQGSVAKEADVKRLFAEAHEAFGRLDILVNNAGIYQFGALEEVTEAEFHRQFDTNVLGPILATREAVKRFPAEGGSVINISSIASEKGLPGATIYGATKGALDQVTRTHAVELAPRKVRVNTIAPGGVETEGTHTAGIIGSAMEQQMIAGTPLGRMGQPDDVADVAVFLASDASRWITGDRIRVAGGFR
ncbi:SDR family NAD(P)-dependent oxidoreductase [Aquabacterium sp. OR-4]|uniref:SDR family NAD(P)-dependent oxidoreductase n=1 Tax=Aquabacterium sp. OR-4 TaxID=2978127 RepID=UPI0021B3377F|nr:glucose 1-dehydrogenase [Aquabacterium sp. OR-4]MDT7833838.1 glucose 1-dehydrogenase [Aquabacterium sp. OR-4]